MNSPKPRKPAPNADEFVRKQSRDIHEDRGTLQSKFAEPKVIKSLVRVRVQASPPMADRRSTASSRSVVAGARLSQGRKLPPERRVVLRLFKNGARRVCVAGTFNNWQPEKTPLRQNEGGEWEIALSLAPGDYEYRFVADGEWLDDPLAGRHVTNPYGSENAVLHVYGE